MNRHDDAEKRVSTWLHDEAHGVVPDWVLDQTFQTTRSTKQQRGLRGWLASIQNSSGSTTRRRSNVFNLAGITAVAATAVLATGVVMSVAQQQPLGPGQAPSAITVAEEMFTGNFSYGPPFIDENGQEVEGMFDMDGPFFSDPRLQGRVIMTANSAYTDDNIYRNSFRIVTEDGAWQGGSVPGLMFEDRAGTSVHLFVGEEGYAGLYAVAEVQLREGIFLLRGYVVEGGFPEL